MQTELVNRLKRIDHLIRIKGTGTADQLAQKLGMSRRSIYNHLSLMRNMGAPIKYDNYRNSFYYEEKGEFIIKFSFEKERTQISGLATQIVA